MNEWLMRMWNSLNSREQRQKKVKKYSFLTNFFLLIITFKFNLFEAESLEKDKEDRMKEQMRLQREKFLKNHS